ncbi:HERC1, partial [Symbiodinium necroappetens]
MISSCFCPAMDTNCDAPADQKDQMQKLVEEVLQKQHNALILRLESWLSKLDSKLDEHPPRAISDWARQATPAQMTNRLSNRSTRSRQNE